MSHYKDIIRLQAEEHPIVNTDSFESLEEFCLSLIHRKAYEEAAALSKDRIVLDLGCNNGYGTNVIGKQCRRVIGVDVSPNAINQAKDMVKADNISFQLIDGKSLPFDDSVFDIIVSFQVIEHIANLEKFMSEILRVLSKDGLVIFTTPNAAIRLDPGMKPWNKFHVQEFTALELKKLLSKWFDSVRVKGLFASSKLYKIERERCRKALIAAKCQRKNFLPPWWKVRTFIINQLKKIMPEFTISSLRKMLRILEASSSGNYNALSDHKLSYKNDFSREFTTDDLYYGQDNLDAALDLMALCSKPKKQVMV